MHVSQLFDQSPAERNATMRATGQPTHRGPDDWVADINESNRRALISIKAMRNGEPRPVWGRRRAD